MFIFVHAITCRTWILIDHTEILLILHILGASECFPKNRMVLHIIPFYSNLMHLSCTAHEIHWIAEKIMGIFH